MSKCFALFLNPNKPQSKSLGESIKDYLLEKKQEVLLIKELNQADPKRLQKVDFLLSMGGDGTILRLLAHLPLLKAPLIGINLGSLGFMADIPIDDVYPCLEEVIKGNYQVEKRLVLLGEGPQGEKDRALNEFVIHRAKNPSLIELAIHVDGAFINTFTSDGIILSTPTGSTAYSLAAGGPILAPHLQALVLTPISPHTISNRPMVFLPEKEVKIQYLSEGPEVEIHCDGIKSYPMKSGEVLTLTCSKHPFNMLRLNRHNYYTTLRTKLNWSGKLRSTSL